MGLGFLVSAETEVQFNKYFSFYMTNSLILNLQIRIHISIVVIYIYIYLLNSFDTMNSLIEFAFGMFHLVEFQGTILWWFKC